MSDTSMVINTNIVVNNDSTTSEQQYVNELRDLGPDQLCDKISSLAFICDSKRNELINARRELERFQQLSIDKRNEYNSGKVDWTAAKCAVMAATGAASLVPGVGWVATIFGGIVLTLANIAVMKADHNYDKRHKEEIRKLILEMEQKANNMIPFAETAVTKQNQFDNERMKLIEQGFSPEQAAIVMIMALLQGKYQNLPQINVNITHSVASNIWNPAYFPCKKVVEQIAKEVFKDSANAAKAITVTSKFVRGTFVAVAAIGVAIDVYTCAKACLAPNLALDKNKEIIAKLDGGINALDYFSRLLRHVLGNISRNYLRNELRLTRQQLQELGVTVQERFDIVGEKFEVVQEQIGNIDERIEVLSRQQQERFDNITKLIVSAISMDRAQQNAIEYS